MSIRRFDDPENRVIKAYLIKPNQQRFLFFCREQIIKHITNPMGELMADGFRMLVTNSDLDFAQNDQVQITGESHILLVENVTQEIDERDNNGLRGNPRYVKRIHVQ